MTTTTTPPKIRFVREDAGVYLVYDGDDLLGTVNHAWFTSNIRRGRLQTSPWWVARRAIDDVPVVVDSRDAWQTRADAAAALVKDLAR